MDDKKVIIEMDKIGTKLQEISTNLTEFNIQMTKELNFFELIAFFDLMREMAEMNLNHILKMANKDEEVQEVVIQFRKMVREHLKVGSYNKETGEVNGYDPRK